MTDTETTNLLRRLYHLSENGFEQVACEVVLEYLEHKLSESHFASVDAFLVETDVERLKAVVLLAILSITWHGRNQISQRARFMEIAERKMIGELGAERTKKLLETRR